MNQKNKQNKKNKQQGPSIPSLFNKEDPCAANIAIISSLCERCNYQLENFGELCNVQSVAPPFFFKLIFATVFPQTKYSGVCLPISSATKTLITGLPAARSIMPFKSQKQPKVEKRKKEVEINGVQIPFINQKENLALIEKSVS